MECAREVASTGAVAKLRVTAVVANVCVALAAFADAWAADDRKTSAAPGAGTWIVQVLAVWSQETVWTTSVPVRRPSAWKRPPKVCIMTISIVYGKVPTEESPG